MSLAVWFSANTSLTLITSYSGEILSRTFAQSMIILQMLSAKLINNKKMSIVLLLILLISPPLSIVNAYGNEAIDYVSFAEISGANFLFDYSSNSSLVYSLHPRAWNIRYNTKLTNWGIDLNNNPETYNVTYFKKLFNDTFISINTRDIENYEFTSSNLDLTNLINVKTSKKFNKIFDSQSFSIYKLEA